MVVDTDKQDKVTPRVVKSEEPRHNIALSVQDMTLPDLLASITRRLLNVLENGDVSSKQTEINLCRSDLKAWYDSRPATMRKEVAKDARRILQNYRNIGEQLHSDVTTITAQDM